MSMRHLGRVWMCLKKKADSIRISQEGKNVESPFGVFIRVVDLDVIFPFHLVPR